MSPALASEGIVLRLSGDALRTKPSPFTQLEGWREHEESASTHGRRPHPPVSLENLSAVGDRSVDAVFSPHGLEQLYPHQVNGALQECLRVLRPEGFLLLSCNDLKAAAKLIAAEKSTEMIDMTPAEPMAAIDLVYGHRASIAEGKSELAHHCGFTGHSLIATLRDAGFQQIAAWEAPGQFEIWALATKTLWPAENLQAAAKTLFPVTA